MTEKQKIVFEKVKATLLQPRTMSLSELSRELAIPQTTLKAHLTRLDKQRVLEFKGASIKILKMF